MKSKGEVLRFAWERLSRRGYDAVCVFDADNLADPQFLREMNNAYRAGARAAQGFRDSKNPYDSVVSGCYSIYYWMMDRLHNGGRAGLGLPAMVNGTGFMVAASVLDRMAAGGRRPSARIWSCRSSAPWRRYRSFGPQRRSPMTSSR